MARTLIVEVLVVRGLGNRATEPEYATMGDRLRQARLARGLSLRKLAEVLGVSPSLISQVETGRAKPSVNTLYALANELGISLDVLLFMDTEPPRPVEGRDGMTDAVDAVLPHDPVQRAVSRTSIRLGSGVVWERLTTESIRNVDFLHVTYEVGGASSPEDEFQRHSGQEWGYVLSGTLTVRIGFDEFLLGPGDAISFDSATPHRMVNGGDTAVTAVGFVIGRRPADVAVSTALHSGHRPRRGQDAKPS
jgi:transcriptional regulator with XRE-family HTH domain